VGGHHAGTDAYVRNRLLLGTAALFAFRLGLSLVRAGPLVFADELGYLSNARVLTGGLPAQLSLAPFYHGGYSLLISPLFLLGAGPQVTYHLVLALNAALAASMFWLLHLLLRRCIGIPPRQALAPAFAGSVYPSLTVMSQVAMSENLLAPLSCVWLISAWSLLSARPPGRLLAAGVTGAIAAALWAVHGRMLAALALTVSVAGSLVWRRPRRWRAALVTLLVLGVGVGAAQALSHFLAGRGYGSHASGELGTRLSALLGIHPLLTVLTNLVGQFWYLVVATFGLTVVVGGGTIDAALGRRRPRGGRWQSDPAGARGSGEQARVALLLVGALAVALLVISAGAFPTRFRPDMLIYGRYTEIIAPALVAVGLARLARRGSAFPRRGFLLALVALTLLVVLIRQTAHDPGIANRWDVASLPFLTFQLGSPVLLGAAAVAAAGAWMLGSTRRRMRFSPAVTACCLYAAVVAYGVLNPVLETQRAVYPSGWTSPQPVATRLRITHVAYDLSHYDVVGLYAVQWYLPHAHLELYGGGRQAPPSPFVLSGRGWGRAHPAAHAGVIWCDRGRDQVLWQLASPSASAEHSAPGSTPPKKAGCR